MANPHERHAEACERHRLAALEYAGALERGDKYGQAVAYQEVHEAFIEANELFLDCIKDLLNLK